MPDILVNGVRLHYTEQGSGPETIVFSHSFLLDSRHFDPQIAALKGRYRCIAYDHRGPGQREVGRSGYEMETLYQDATGLIEALGCSPCHFVGLSTGGFIGLRIAIRRPELLKSLVLMDTSADAEPPEAMKQYRLMLFALRWLGYRPVVGRAMPVFFGSGFLQDPSRSQEVRQWQRRMMANDRRAVVDFAKGIFSRGSVYEQIDAIRIPTLVVVGEKDVPTPVEKAMRMVEKIPGAQLKVIANSGHLTTIEAPEAVNAALAAFLDSQG
jgi:pimeloyl-ACP methyl ester carboxylesterase